MDCVPRATTVVALLKKHMAQDGAEEEKEEEEMSLKGKTVCLDACLLSCVRLSRRLPQVGHGNGEVHAKAQLLGRERDAHTLAHTTGA